eukprot:TRINITY_DN5068_c0_g1_i8.p1 TRINITY_DN5068_c0_g1~~TRINITY_DN5068_c0_g1_i8.p1  ORF type:complete len:725 (+),score=196.45 TRINITY_DN5068_c0_g1_i8:60-2177(+)
MQLELGELSKRIDELQEARNVVVQPQVGENAPSRSELQVLSRRVDELQEATRMHQEQQLPEYAAARVGLVKLSLHVDELQEATRALQSQPSTDASMQLELGELSKRIDELQEARNVMSQQHVAEDTMCRSELQIISSRVDELQEASQGMQSQSTMIYQGRPAQNQHQRYPLVSSKPTSPQSSSSRPGSPKQQWPHPQAFPASSDEVSKRLAAAPSLPGAGRVSERQGSTASASEDQAEGLAALRMELKVLTIESRQSRNQGIRAGAEISQALASLQEQRSASRQCEELRSELQQLASSCSGTFQEQQGECRCLRERLSTLASETEEGLSELRAQWSHRGVMPSPEAPVRELSQLGASLREELQQDLRNLSASGSGRRRQHPLSPDQHAVAGRKEEQPSRGGSVSEVLLLHFPDAAWPAPAGFEEALALQLRAGAARAAAQSSLRLLPREAGFVAEVRAPGPALEELQQLPLQDIEIQGSRCGLVWRSWTSAAAEAESPAASSPLFPASPASVMAAEAPSPKRRLRQPAAETSVGKEDEDVTPVVQLRAMQSELASLRALGAENCAERGEWLEELQEMSASIRHQREDGLRLQHELDTLAEELRPAILAPAASIEEGTAEQLALNGQLCSMAEEWSAGVSELRLALQQAWKDRRPGMLWSSRKWGRQPVAPASSRGAWPSLRSLWLSSVVPSPWRFGRPSADSLRS